MKSDLSRKHCKPCDGPADRLPDSAIPDLLRQLPAWTVDAGILRREFKFKNFHETMAFVNAVAWISHQENHHPDMDVGYNRAALSYITHTANGLTENDFICAAKVSTLLNETP